MNRRRPAAVIFLCLLMAFGLIVYAADDSKRVYDKAGLFTQSQSDALEERIAALRQKISMDVVILTIDDAEGKSSMEYADDYYEAYEFGEGKKYSGALFLVDMDNREAWISTEGDMIGYLTDDRIESILDDAYAGLSNGDFGAAAVSFLKGVEKYVDMGVPGDLYYYDTETGKITKPRSLTLGNLLFAAAASLIAGVTGIIVVFSKYKWHAASYRYPLMEKCRLQLTNQEDVLINRTVTHVRVQSSSSSGGSSGSGGSRSSTHRSSSGRTHGGGGRKF